MSAIKINDYRGFEIFFDEDKETFYATSDGRPGWDDKGKISYARVKTSIDEFIKDNAAFEPFKVMPTRKSYVESSRKTIVGIRKDGRFICQGKEGKKEQISEYNEKHYMLENADNEPILAKIAMLEIQCEDLRKDIKKEEEKLTVVTLADIKKNYLQ